MEEIKTDKEELISITLTEDEVLTDFFDNGGDATDYDDADTELEVKVIRKKK